jgi:hypothetical protein
MRTLPTLLLLTMGLPGVFAQDAGEERACGQLLAAIDSLKVMLAQEGRSRVADQETQRMQLVVTLLGFRYRNLENLEDGLRSLEAEEDDIRSATARTQAQLDGLEAESVTPQEQLAQKTMKADIEAVLKGLEERAKGLREREAATHSQVARVRIDIGKLEDTVRNWLEKTP